MDLFDMSNETRKTMDAPLAYRMRPQTLDEVVGQQHIIGQGTSLRRLIEKDELHSFVLYGPPGTGKTTIASIIAHMTHSHFETLQAVTGGVSDIRKIANDAEQRLKYYSQKTVLFVDEIHRFNKSQQDVLLPFAEDGTLVLIGATTENPLFELNNALLSRMKLYILKALESEQMEQIINNALSNQEKGLGVLDIDIDHDSIDFIISNSKGDARMALNILETVVNSFLDENNHVTINTSIMRKILDRPLIKYDKTGDYHYDSISAFIKSIRGSDPDAAIFWLAVMLEGGEDPMFIARRLIVHAAEDIGLADPYALTLASATANAVHFIGMPEARIPLAECTLYLATAPKSNSSITAIDNAIASVRESKKITVPPHLADAHHSRATTLLGKGKNYKYPHNYGGYVKQQYLPDNMQNKLFYQPSLNGREIKIKAFLDKLK